MIWKYSLIFAASLLTLTALGLYLNNATKAQAIDRFIDVHTHYQDKPDYIDRVVREYSKYKAMVVIMAPVEAFDKVIAAAKKHPDVIIPFADINIDAPDILEQIDRAHAAGFKGIGELTRPLKNLDDERYFPIYERAQRLGLVVLFHTGVVARNKPEEASNVSVSRLRPAYLDTIARNFPRLQIIGAHLGNPWYEEAAEVARLNPNIYFDMSGSTLVKKLKLNRLDYFKEVLWWSPDVDPAHMPPKYTYGFDKIVFASDEPPEGLKSNLDRYQKLFDACQVPQHVRRNVMWNNAAKLFGISDRAHN